MSVTRRLRYEILRRDGHACRYCGAQAPDVKLTVDHVIPVALGGSDAPENLVAACADCNSGKSATPPDADLVAAVADDALRWARAMAQAAELDAARRTDRQLIYDWFDGYWRDYFTAEHHEQYGWWRDQDWQGALDRFLSAGLTPDDLAEYVDITMRAKAVANGDLWRYFCGVCWKRIRERQETARRLIESGEADWTGH